jgi:hypothetical protein
LIPRKLRDAFLERPERMLALMLSVPNSRANKSIPSVTIDFTENEVIARVQHSHVLRLFATKQTIFAAILLHHLIHERGPDFADSLVERAVSLSEAAAHHDAELWLNAANYQYSAARSPNFTDGNFFREFFGTSSKDLEVAQSRTEDALRFLEDEGLVIDPAFTPELMVLVGLFPVHFSVRTPKGERIHREIRVNAAMWNLEVTRGSKDGRRYTDIEFRVRGVEIVREAITAMASQYLESEAKIRRRRGQRVLRRKGEPELDEE